MSTKQEAQYLKRELATARFLLEASYFQLRLSGMTENDIETSSIARWLYKAYGETIEGMYAGYKAADDMDKKGQS